MSTVIDWNQVGDDGGKGKSGKGVNFLQLRPGTYEVRLLGTPVAMNKFMVQSTDGRWKSAVVEHPKDNPVTKNHGIEPSERYAINCLDRADGILKVLEGGVKVFGEFKTYWKHTGKNPGASAEGADFKIVVTGAGRSKQLKTTFEKNTPLTKEETVYIKETCGGLYELKEIFKVVPNDRLEERLFPDEHQASGSPVQASVADNAGVDAPTGNISPDTEEVGDDLPF